MTRGWRWPDHSPHRILHPVARPRHARYAANGTTRSWLWYVAPDGWKVKVVPFRFDLKKAKLIGTIMVIDEFSFDLMQRQ